MSEEKNSTPILYREYQIQERTLRLYNTNNPARLEEETYEEYKIRQKFNYAVEKEKRNPKLVWDSYLYGQVFVEKPTEEKSNKNNNNGD